MTLKEELGYGLDALVLFRGLQQNPVIHALMEFCHADSSDLANQIRTYSSIVAALYPATDNLTDYMEKIVLEEETVYVQRRLLCLSGKSSGYHLQNRHFR